MESTPDIKAILDAAVLREEEAHAFYRDVAARVSNPTVQQTFVELAQDELGHKVFLQACLQEPGLLLRLPVPRDYKVAEATAEPALSTDMKPADALALAMKKEQRAAQFYQALAEASPDAVTQSMFANLARMELGHKTRLENLFVDIGYPEVF